MEYNKPCIISPEIYDSFEKLYEQRDHIIKLELVPVKHDTMHKYYHTVDHAILADELKQLFEKENIFIIENKFPYWLSEDVHQKIVWINRFEMPKENILDFLKNECSKLEDKKTIIFERPLNITTPLVKGSFPAYRHIHFWTKK